VIHSFQVHDTVLSPVHYLDFWFSAALFFTAEKPTDKIVYWTQHSVVCLETMDQSLLSSTFILVFDCAISRWNTANVGFKPDKSHGAFSSRDLSALKPRFSFLFFSIENQPFPNYRMTSIGHEPQLLILSLQFLSIPHSEIPAIFMHGEKRAVYTWIKHHKKAYRSDRFWVWIL
jgi:hypothetical protein